MLMNLRLRCQYSEEDYYNWQIRYIFLQADWSSDDRHSGNIPTHTLWRNDTDDTATDIVETVSGQVIYFYNIV